MRKLFKEYGENLNNYKYEYDWLNLYYIADDKNFKKQVTIRDYYRILLVDNAGDLTVEELNTKLEIIKSKKDILYYDIDSYEEILEVLNSEYDLNIEFNESLYYDDFDYFKHGYIVYDKENNCFDSAENWDEVVTTFIYLEEHDYVATMEIEIENENLESIFPEIHIDELDELEELEVIRVDDIDEEKEIIVLENSVVESTSVKKLYDDKYLIVITSKIAGHIDLAAVVTERELIKYLGDNRDGSF
ncbi:MAG: hypothetical protein WBJ13_02865 [Sedimentibacter sp.]